MFDRRQVLIGGAAASLIGPRLAWATAETERRVIFLIQRGAADGLATLAPTGDPAYAGLRGELAAELMDRPRLGGMFALHPALERIGGLYGEGQALFAHAVASPYRDRSHFDGQNVLETGGERPYERKDGWMNRLIGLIPGAPRALAISATIPAALRGSIQVSSYAPTNLPEAPQELLQRVSMLYESDAQLHALWGEALQTRAMAGDLAGGTQRGAVAAGQLIASLMAGPDGARIVMAETTGWDTHAGQRGRLNTQLTALDALIGALKDSLGAAWSQTLVIVATEFGRTAAVNGTGGTDHGTGSLAMLLGGTVAGGRILADWPGLAPAQLYEGRDLKPTQSIDAVLAGALAGHFGLDPQRAAPLLFPGGAGRPLTGLIKG